MCIFSTGYHGILSLNNGKDTDNAIAFAKQHVESLDEELRIINTAETRCCTTKMKYGKRKIHVIILM